MEKIYRHVGYETIEAVAGGETAGIPFAAWIADRMPAPMAYVRKQPKGFGRNALIEGDVPEGQAHPAGGGPDHRRPVEDPLRQGAARRRRDRQPHLRGVLLRRVPRRFETLARMDISLHHLCTWWDVLEAAQEPALFLRCRALAEVRKFLENPVAWSAAHGGVATAEEALAHKLGKAAK